MSPGSRDTDTRRIALTAFALLSWLALAPPAHAVYNVASFWKKLTSGLLQWTWMNGASAINTIGTYGTQGTPASANTPGGRNSPASWIDPTGNLWLFGGNGYDTGSTLGYLNDLWKYYPSVNQWVWVAGSNSINSVGTYGTQGTASTSNIPGARGNAITWKDTSGNFWLFGGRGYGTTTTLGYLNDLWKYDPSTQEWTWVAGSNGINQVGTYGTKGTGSTSNIPGARQNAISWKDSSGNFWLFGGNGYDTSAFGRLNDLWKFNPSNNEWTWVSGSNSMNQSGTYGTQGTGSTSNIPGARANSSSWKDDSDILWLFGGFGFDTGATAGRLNDLWKFNSANGEWTWVSGSNSINQVSTPGTKGTPSTSNIPGGRQGPTTWIDSSGTFWLLAGYGNDTTSTAGYMNDLWKYSPGTNEWTWVDGSSSRNQTATYGTKASQSSSSYSGSRRYFTGWYDSSGTLWFFGGEGYDTASTVGNLNDLWRYR